MALAEAYYVTAPEHDFIPGQMDWYQDLDDVKTDAVDCAEENSVHVIYEITVRPVYRTVATITLESI